MKYIFNGNVYDTMQDAQDAVIAIHPELLDDDMPDFFNANIEEVATCPICGALVYIPSWGSGCCSARCWGELYGEP